MSDLILMSPYPATGGGGPSFDETNMLWRVRAASESYANNAEAITLTDLSGNSRNWAVSGGSVGPTFKTNQINGHPAYDFPGRVFGPDLSGLGLTEIDLFIILWINTDPPASNQGLWVMNNRVGAHSAGTYTLTDGTLLESACLSGATDIRLSVNPTPSLAVPRLYRVTAKTGTGNYKMYLDGSLIQSGTRNTLEFPTAPELGNSRNDSAGLNFAGFAPEFCGFSAECGSTQLDSIRDYCNDFYAMSVV